jgi:thymidylate synthase (FAD)
LLEVPGEEAMKVSLVSITQPDLPHDRFPDRCLSAEELIVYTARVSSPANQSNTETAPRLLRYLIRHGHWSPFEMVDMTVEIETSRAIAAQILRHRSFVFQEFSQRYAEVDLGFETYEARRQDDKNRQASHDDLPPNVKVDFGQMQDEVWRYSYNRYREALDRGVAKECARFLLPLSTRTRLYMKGSVRSWIHYFAARCAPETQKEHRDVANAVKGVFADQFPNVMAALSEAEESK